MYAIIRTGGKQYKVKAGDVVRVEKIERDLGDEFELTDILMVGGDKSFFGKPTVQNAKVTVVVTRQDKAPKVIVFKKRRRQGYRKLRGHRQMYTELFVKAITSPDGQISQTEAQAPIFSAQAKMEAILKKREEKKSETKVAGPKKTVAKKAAAKKTVKKKTGKKAVKRKTAKKATGTTKKKATTTKKS